MDKKVTAKILEFNTPNHNLETFTPSPTITTNHIPVTDENNLGKFVGLAKLDNLPNGLFATISLTLNNQPVSFEITNIQSGLFPRIFFTGTEDFPTTQNFSPYTVLNKSFTYFVSREDK